MFSRCSFYSIQHARPMRAVRRARRREQLFCYGRELCASGQSKVNWHGSFYVIAGTEIEVLGLVTRQSRGSIDCYEKRNAGDGGEGRDLRTGKGGAWLLGCLRAKGRLTMRPNTKRAVVGALFASLCGGAYAQSVGAGGGADAGATASNRPGAGASSKAGPGAPAAGVVTDSTLAGARAG